MFDNKTKRVVVQSVVRENSRTSFGLYGYGGTSDHASQNGSGSLAVRLRATMSDERVSSVDESLRSA